MPLANHPRTLRWLDQFSLSEQAAARGILTCLNLVSSSEWWSATEKMIRQLPLKSGQTAFFPITANSSAGTKAGFTSAGQIGHFLRRFAASDRKRFAMTPTPKSMLAARTKNIVLVDDMIGSGKRMIDFWQNFSTPTLRSWLSFGYCRIWVLTYALDFYGRDRIIARAKNFSKNCFIYSIRLDDALNWPNQAKSFFETVGAKTFKPLASFGFRKRCSNVVFQHGCPNTVPSALWSNGKSYFSLFPERHVPTEFFEFFQTKTVNKFPEKLWQMHQYRLAMRLSEKIEGGDLSEQGARLLTLVGLRLKGIPLGRLGAVMTCGRQEIVALAAKAKSHGLITEDGDVTDSGRALVAEFRRERRKELGAKTIEEAASFYYPSSYRGLAKI